MLLNAVTSMSPPAPPLDSVRILPVVTELAAVILLCRVISPPSPLASVKVSKLPVVMLPLLLVALRLPPCPVLELERILAVEILPVAFKVTFPACPFLETVVKSPVVLRVPPLVIPILPPSWVPSVSIAPVATFPAAFTWTLPPTARLLSSSEKLVS